MVAVTGNYCLNAKWTFGNASSPTRLGVRQFASYVAANALGLGMNLAVLTATLKVAGHAYHIVGQLLGIACGMVFNFLAAKYVVFKAKQSA